MEEDKGERKQRHYVKGWIVGVRRKERKKEDASGNNYSLEWLE